MTIDYLVWQYVEAYKFYRIQYVLDGYYHKIQLSDWNVDCNIPTFMCKKLRATLNCVPEERDFSDGRRSKESIKERYIARRPSELG